MVERIKDWSAYLREKEDKVLKEDLAKQNKYSLSLLNCASTGSG